MKKAQIKVSLAAPMENPAVLFIYGAYEKRRAKNSRYSIRSFCRVLDIDHSLLSKIFNGRTTLSQKTMMKCLHRLDAPADFIQECIRNMDKGNYWQDMPDDEFEILSDWRHFAILELMLLPNFQLTPVSASKLLGISEEVAFKNIKCLLSLGYIQISGEAYVLRDKEMSTTSYSPEKSSKARALFQSNLLDESKKSIKQTAFNLRDHSSVIVAVNDEDMPRFKEWIKDARRQLTTLFQTDKNYNQVYSLQISFFPLSNRGDSK